MDRFAHKDHHHHLTMEHAHPCERRLEMLAFQQIEIGSSHNHKPKPVDKKVVK